MILQVIVNKKMHLSLSDNMLMNLEYTKLSYFIINSCFPKYLN